MTRSGKRARWATALSAAWLRGSVRRAAADLRRAEQLFAECGQELESADAIVQPGAW